MKNIKRLLLSIGIGGCFSACAFLYNKSLTEDIAIGIIICGLVMVYFCAISIFYPNLTVNVDKKENIEEFEREIEDEIKNELDISPINPKKALKKPLGSDLRDREKGLAKNKLDRNNLDRNNKGTVLKA